MTLSLDRDARKVYLARRCANHDWDGVFDLLLSSQFEIKKVVSLLNASCSHFLVYFDPGVGEGVGLGLRSHLR